MNGWDNWYKESERARTKNAWRGVGDVSWLSFKGAETEKQCKSSYSSNYSSNKTQAFEKTKTFERNGENSNTFSSNKETDTDVNSDTVVFIGAIFFMAMKYFGVL